jgi:hypothetical protein
MGYVEKIMGDNEEVVHRTHRHVIVLMQRVLGSLFAFVVLFGLGLAVLVSPANLAGDQVRGTIGLIALGSLIMPLYLIASAWVRGLRGQDFTSRIWRAVVAGIAILALSLIMIIHPEFSPIGWIAVAIAAIPFGELIRILLDWINERYIITNRRVMEVGGIINKHVRDSALEKVNDVDLKQSVVGRLLGFGTVQIITGSDIGVNMFHRISNPVRFKREMLNAKEKLHGEEEDEGLAKLSAAHGKADIPDLIVELDGLRQKGIISETEFQAKKQELLGRL